MDWLLLSKVSSHIKNLKELPIIIFISPLIDSLFFVDNSVQKLYFKYKLLIKILFLSPLPFLQGWKQLFDRITFPRCRSCRTELSFYSSINLIILNLFIKAISPCVQIHITPPTSADDVKIKLFLVQLPSYTCSCNNKVVYSTIANVAKYFY